MQNAHSYGNDANSRPDVDEFVQADDPQGRREALIALGCTGLALEHEIRTATAATRFPHLTSEREIYRRYFSRELVPGSQEHHDASARVLAEIMAAHKVTDGKRAIFDHFSLMAAPTGERFLVLGEVQTTLENGVKQTDQFLVAQWPGESLETPETMREYFKSADRAAARGAWTRKLRASVGGFLGRNWPLLSGLATFASGLIFVVILRFGLFGILVGALGCLVAVVSFLHADTQKRLTARDIVAASLGVAALLMMMIYGLVQAANIPQAPQRTIQETVLICKILKAQQDDDNIQSEGGIDRFYATVITGDGHRYEIVTPVTFAVTSGPAQNGVFPASNVYENTSSDKAATDMFHVGHAYMVTRKNHVGDRYFDGITAAHEVPNTLGQCG